MSRRDFTLIERGEQRVLLVATEGLGQLSSVRLVFSTSHLDDHHAGELALLAEWLERGTERLGRQELGEAFVATGCTPDFSLRSTGFETGLDALQDLLPEALELLCEQLFRPAFDESEFAQLRAELDEDDDASLDDPGFIASLNSRYARWGRGHRASLPPRGTPGSRAELTREDVVNRHRDLQQEPALIVIVGPRPTDSLKTLDSLFRRHELAPARALRRPALPSLQGGRARVSVVDVPELEHAMVSRWGVALPSDNAEQVGRLRLVHAALCEGMSAPLLHRLRGQAGLSYSVHSSLVDRGAYVEQVFEVEPSPARVEEALNAARALWQDAEALRDHDYARAAVQLRMDAALTAADPWRSAADLMRTCLLHNRPLSWLDAREQAQEKVEQLPATPPLHSWGPGFDGDFCLAVSANASALPARFAEHALPLNSFLAEIGW